MRRVIAYIRGTIGNVRIIGYTSLHDIFIRIDVAYAVNPDMKSQMGGTMSLGIGILHAKCSKQELNVKSSTETELVESCEHIHYNL